MAITRGDESDQQGLARRAKQSRRRYHSDLDRVVAERDKVGGQEDGYESIGDRAQPFGCDKELGVALDALGKKTQVPQRSGVDWTRSSARNALGAEGVPGAWAADGAISSC